MSCQRALGITGGLFGVLCVVLGCGSDIGSRSLSVINGSVNTSYSNVGYVLGGPGFCTGTLVGARTVLTASHCVVPSNGEHTFYLGESSFPSRAVIRHPSWNTDPSVVSPENDIGLVLLQTAPPATPAEISVTQPAVGMSLTMVGLGGNGAGEPNGTRRSATNVVDEVLPSIFRFSMSTSQQGSTCRGDSGGPAFAQVAGKEVVMGVFSTSDNDPATNCANFTWSARVDTVARWLAEQSEGDLAGDDLLAPTVTITQPADGARFQLNETISIQAQLTDDRPGETAELLLDGTLSGNKSGAPFAFEATFDTEGAHVIKIVAGDAAGNTASDEVTVYVGDEPAASENPATPTDDGTTPAGDGDTNDDNGLVGDGDGNAGGNAGANANADVDTGSNHNEDNDAHLAGGCQLGGQSEEGSAIPIAWALLLLAALARFRKRRSTTSDL